MILIIAALAGATDYHRCMAGVDYRGLVKNQMLACATTEMDRADHALNVRYRAVMQALPPDRRAVLRVAERRWIDRRRATCDVSRQDAIPSPEINRMRCLVRLTDQRTNVVNRFR